MSGSSDPMVHAMHTAMARSSRRLEAVAANLMNVDTPGYRAVQVVFDDWMPRPLEVARTDAHHHQAADAVPARGTVVQSPYFSMRDDGNTVDLDREMLLLAKLQGHYRTSAALVRKRFALWKYAVTDGRTGG